MFEAAFMKYSLKILQTSVGLLTTLFPRNRDIFWSVALILCLYEETSYKWKRESDQNAQSLYSDIQCRFIQRGHRRSLAIFINIITVTS